MKNIGEITLIGEPAFIVPYCFLTEFLILIVLTPIGKNEEAIKKSENLRDTCACKGLSINTMHGPIQSRETVPLSYT